MRIVGYAETSNNCPGIYVVRRRLEHCSNVVRDEKIKVMYVVI